MTNQRFIFHIGAHKTGTTYIQAALAALAPRLRAHGVLVPDIWHQNARQPGHHQLAQRLAAGALDALTEDFALLRGSGFERVVVSSEALTTISAEAIGLLARVLADHDARFVFHCRRPSDLLPSNWQETVRQGGTQPLPVFVATNLNRGAKGSILNFGLKLEPFAQAFGRDRITILSYSNVVDAKLDLASHFITSILPDVVITRDDVRAAMEGTPNVSWPYWRIELLRAMNALAVERGERPGSRIRMWLTRRGDSVDLGAVRDALTQGRRVLTVDDAHRTVADIYQRLYGQWGDRMAPPVVAGGFFTPMARGVEYVSAGLASRPQVAVLIEEIYHEYRQNPLPAVSARAA